MKSTKRLLCLLLCAAMALSLLAACGGQGEESQPTANGTETTTTPTTVPETTVPETTPAPTEPPMPHLAPDELEERINQELLSRGIPCEMEIVHGSSYDQIVGILSPTSDDDFLKNLEIIFNFDAGMNVITQVNLSTFPYSYETNEPLTQTQQKLFMEMCAAVSKAFDPTCSDEALAAMINVSCTNLTGISEQYEYGQEIFDDVILHYGTNYTETQYNNKAEDVNHIIGSQYDGDSLSSLDFSVYSTVDQSSQAVSVNKDVSTCITIAELESLLNEKFTELGLPLALTIEKNVNHNSMNERGAFRSDISYTGEYADVETNKLIRKFKSLFSIALDATGVSRDSLIRSVEFGINANCLEELYASGPEYIDPLTAAFTEIAFTIASALDDQVPDDILEQLSAATPYDIWESTYDGVTTVVTSQSDVFSGLFCQREEQDQSDLAYPWISYTFDVIDLMSEEFDPHIPHGDEVNEPQYLEHKMEIGNHVMNPEDYISYFHELPKSASWLHDFTEGTYSPITVDSYGSNMMATETEYGFVFQDAETGLSGSLDTDHYYVWEFCDDYPTVNEVYAYYNTNYKEYFPQEYLSAGLDPEYTLRVPIGISLMFDEEMTPEELSQLHTGKMEPTDSWRDYQVTVYCPRDIMHILLSNPATGGHQFWLLEKARFDELYGDLTTFLDAKAEGKFYVDP